jgi:hypothetical protein
VVFFVTIIFQNGFFEFFGENLVLVLWGVDVVVGMGKISEVVALLLMRKFAMNWVLAKLTTYILYSFQMLYRIKIRYINFTIDTLKENRKCLKLSY